ncbi:TIM barrel protein [Candidatus Latescibacterota bacterium]
MKSTERLLFGTAGVPKSSKLKSTISGFERLKELGLDIMELEYVRGTFPGETKAREIAAAAKEIGIRLSAHGPYYINLNAVEPEKLAASRERIMKTAIRGSMSGAESITFHAGFFLGQDSKTVYSKIKKEIEEIIQNIREKRYRC